jgi:hypothetical protein
MPILVSDVTNTEVYIDPSARKYFYEFISLSKKYKSELNLRKHITVFSDKPKEGLAGYCLLASNTVVISTKVWDTLNDAGKKALLFHEWGHCILRREHVDDYAPLANGFCPISIMYPYIDPAETCYNKHNKTWYDEELFINPYNYKKFSRRKK